MNTMNKLMIAAVMIISLAWLESCKKDEKEIALTAQQTAARMLAATWGSTTVVSSPVSGANGNLASLTLTFASTNAFQPAVFTATGAPDYFETVGNSTWSWEDDNTIVKIKLNNVSPVNMLIIEQVTETSLTLNFELSELGSGRINGLGEYRITLTRQ